MARNKTSKFGIADGFVYEEKKEVSAPENNIQKDIKGEKPEVKKEEEEIMNQPIEEVQETKIEDKKEEIYKESETEPKEETVPVPEVKSEVAEVIEKEVPETRNEVINIVFNGFKKETKSVKKMLLMKPSTVERINILLNNEYKGLSFNELVNQMLEAWLKTVEKGK